jgi:type I restriction enzyme S subunit
MSELPKGWVTILTGDIGEWRGGGTPSKANSRFWTDGTVPWVSPKDMKRAHIAEAIDNITSEAIAGSATQLIPEGSVLIVTRSGILQHSLPVAANTVPVAINQDLKALTPHKGIEPEFVMRQLQADAQEILDTCAKSGTTVDSIDFERLKKHEFRLPPLPEQRRIVAKVDGLTARTARARKELDRIPTLIARYKQRLLALGLSGEMTADWRHATGLHEVWPSAKLAELALVGTGSTPKRGTPAYYANGTIPWVTSGAVNADLVSTATEFITDAAIRETNCKVFPAGTLLVAMYGEGQTRGKVAVLGIPAATNQALAAIQIKSKRVTSQFVFWYLKSSYLNLREQAAGGVQPNLSLGLIKQLDIPLPPLEEQTEIVRRIESAFSWLDRMAADHAAAARLLPKLDAAILTKAFRGELVPQDPNDEPASALLERIKMERKAEGAKPTGSHGRKPNGSKERPMTNKAMQPRDRLLEDSKKWPTVGLPFEAIAMRNPMHRDELRDALFELLSGPSPSLQQRFDTDAEIMVIQRVAA